MNVLGFAPERIPRLIISALIGFAYYHLAPKQNRTGQVSTKYRRGFILPSLRFGCRSGYALGKVGRQEDPEKSLPPSKGMTCPTAIKAWISRMTSIMQSEIQQPSNRVLPLECRTASLPLPNCQPPLPSHNIRLWKKAFKAFSLICGLVHQSRHQSQRWVGSTPSRS